MLCNQRRHRVDKVTTKRRQVLCDQQAVAKQTPDPPGKRLPAPLVVAELKELVQLSVKHEFVLVLIHMDCAQQPVSPRSVQPSRVLTSSRMAGVHVSPVTNPLLPVSPTRAHVAVALASPMLTTQQ